MPDDEGRRRRLGDETKNRIADLASGWSLDGEPDVPAAPVPVHTPTPKPKPVLPGPEPGPPPRTKARTAPPPPPGSPERKVAEQRSGSTTRPPGVKTSTMSSSVVGEARAKPSTAPPRGASSTILAVASDAPARDDDSGIEIPFVRDDDSGILVPSRRDDDSGILVSSGRDDDSGILLSTPLPVPRADDSEIVPPPGRAASPTPLPPTPRPSSQRAGDARSATPRPSSQRAGDSRPPASRPASDSRAPGSGPRFPRADYAGPPSPLSTGARTPPVILDDSLRLDPRTPIPATPVVAAASKLAAMSSAPFPLPAPAESYPGLTVPVGEFDSGIQTVQQDALSESPLLKIPDKIVPIDDLLEDEPERGDATMIDPLTGKFERGDPTSAGESIEGRASGNVRQPSGGTLRPSAALRRKRGLLGDVRYVFTALFGVREARRELAELERRQALRQTSRRRHLITLGRTAVISEGFDHPVLGKAREQLQAIEDERSRHAGAVSASDAELERVRRDRDTKAKQYITDIAATDGELTELTRKLEPLEKEATVARKRAQELRDSLQRIAKRIGDTEALMSSVKAEKMDKAAILADLATLKADRQSVLKDEPAIAAQLDALTPRVAAMEGARNELKKKRGELEKAEVDDQRRAAELLEAIGAKRKVVERAAADAETARDNALFELGDRLYVDRPKDLAAQLAPIDQIDLELGDGDRRTMELREIISNVDKWKLARGAAMLILALAVFGAIVFGVFYVVL